MNIDDPKLTAFALDELDEPERSTFARAVARPPAKRADVEAEFSLTEPAGKKELLPAAPPVSARTKGGAAVTHAYSLAAKPVRGEKEYFGSRAVDRRDADVAAQAGQFN